VRIHDEYIDKPAKYNGELPSYADKIVVSQTDEDLFRVKLIAWQIRIPEIGDKFSSRHGQKGVVGIIVP